jgi:RNA polymerase sigma factor for flagellar operon FliA
MTAAPQHAVFATDEEAALWRRLKSSGDIAAREALFNLFQPYAKGLARRHFLDRSTGDIELGDLTQLAYAGLLEAIDGFDPDHGAPFRAFARRRITGSVLDGVSKASEVREQISFRNRLRRERTRSLTLNADLAAIETMSGEDVLQSLLDVAVGLALGFMLDDSELYRTDDGPDRGPNAYETLAWKETVLAALRCVADLPQRERNVIEHHYIRGLRFDQLATVMGLSKGRISQLHRSALLLLRQRLLAERHFSLER